MTYPDCYEPAEHRRALGKVLDDLKAVVKADAEAANGREEQCAPEAAPDPHPDPVVQVRSTCPGEVGLISEPVN